MKLSIECTLPINFFKMILLLLWLMLNTFRVVLPPA